MLGRALTDGSRVDDEGPRVGGYVRCIAVARDVNDCQKIPTRPSDAGRTEDRAGCTTSTAAGPATWVVDVLFAGFTVTFEFQLHGAFLYYT